MDWRSSLSGYAWVGGRKGSGLDKCLGMREKKLESSVTGGGACGYRCEIGRFRRAPEPRRGASGGVPPPEDQEGRARTKENVGVPGTVRPQRRVAVSRGLGGVRGGAGGVRCLSLIFPHLLLIFSVGGQAVAARVCRGRPAWPRVRRRPNSCANPATKSSLPSGKPEWVA